MHSGLQPGGDPINSGKQEQTAWLLTSRHRLFGPHGFGAQGFLTSGGTITKAVLNFATKKRTFCFLH